MKRLLALLAVAITVPFQMTFRADGTGAVSRKIGSKLGDVVSVKDFGADPAASAATNTTAINAALTYVGGLTQGGTVTIPAGAYSVTPTIVINKSNVYLSGAGRGNTVLTGNAASGGSAGVISITAAGALSNVGIADLGITCTGTILTTYASGSGTYNNYGIYTGVDLTALEISGLAVTSCGAGIGTTYPTPPNTLLHGSSIHDNFFYGLSPSVLSTHIAIQIISDTTLIDRNWASGFTVAYNSPPWSNRNRWTNNTGIMPANGNDVCIYLSGAIQSTVAHNHCIMTLPISSTGDGCIKMGAYNDPHVSDKWRVDDNYCENGGIKFSRCAEGSVVDNTVNGSNSAGIFFDNTAFPVWNIQSITASSPIVGQATVVVDSATSALAAPVNITIAGTGTGHDGSHALVATGTNSLIITDATAGNVGVVGTATPFDIAGISESVTVCRDMKLDANTIVDAGRSGASTGEGIKSLRTDRWGLSNNIIKHPNSAGIDLRNGTDVAISGGSISDTTNQAVYLDAIVGGAITGGAYVQTGTFGSTPAIRIGNSSSYVSIVGVRTNNYARGAQVDTGTNDHILITGNNFVGCGGGNCTNGINIDGSCTFCNAGLNAITNFTNIPGSLGGTSSVPASVALVAGAGSVQVPAGCNPWCTDSTAAAAVKCSVSSTTLTIAGTGTDTIKYGCN